MAKKAKARKAKKAGSKKGAKYVCDTCGVILSVDKACECDPCDVTCCGDAMRFVTC